MWRTGTLVDMTVSKRVLVLPTEDGESGPLDGPFTLIIESDNCSYIKDAEAEILEAIVAFVRHVARGVSCYNRNEFDHSSNLRSYAAECLADLESEAPEMAARLESLVIDCSHLPVMTKSHPIWKLDRAILRALPGLVLVE